jgi:transglutaminase-like putative cysteine protease
VSKKNAVSRLLALCAAGLFVAAAGFTDQTQNKRAFSFVYQVHVPASQEKGELRLWIPLPQSDEHQSVSNLSVQSNVPHRRGKEAEYGNAFEMFTPSEAQAAAGYDVTVNFDVTRFEFSRNVSRLAESRAPGKTDTMLARFLQPDKMVPLNERIAELAKEQTSGAAEPLEKARRIYTYVASTMKYDKSGEGWGRGDEMWACDSKRGNCTDFHSVLIGMLRSSGIPARFEIGFPLPEGKSEGDIPGYHCWAEFYLNGVGWVPVDASEASKNPAKRDYFFGTVDANRVRFTYGRDLRLSAEQTGPPLNFFIYPYAERNGQPVKDLKTHFSFQDLPAGQSSRASN